MLRMSLNKKPEHHLDDLTSGYNIALNITMDPRFNQMLGFSEDDVRQMIRYYKEVGAIKPEVTEDSIIADMKPWYDNYCFAKACFGKEPSMFNCDMVCYYLSNLVGLGQRPDEIIDPNTMTDYGKLKRLIEIDQLEGDRLNVIHDIAEHGFIYGQIVSHFPAERMMEFGNFVSLLYYYGMLTIGGVEGELLKLTIPNNNVRLQYYHYLLDEYQSISRVNTTELSLCFSRAALHGDWQPLISFICKAYHATMARYTKMQQNGCDEDFGRSATALTAQRGRRGIRSARNVLRHLLRQPGRRLQHLQALVL